MKFFKTGVVPFPPEETLEIFALMEAAEVSAKRGGAPVTLAWEGATGEATVALKKGCESVHSCWCAWYQRKWGDVPEIPAGTGFWYVSKGKTCILHRKRARRNFNGHTNTFISSRFA